MPPKGWAEAPPPEVYVLQDDVEDHVRLAEALLGDEGVEAAEAKVSLAEGLLEEIVGLLWGVDGDRKAERVLEFLEKTEERNRRLRRMSLGVRLPSGRRCWGRLSRTRGLC